MTLLKFFLLLSAAFYISGCTRTMGPGDTNMFGIKQVDFCELPTGKDIYLTASVLVDFESSYQTLRTDAPKFADAKCGKNSSFKLTDFWMRKSSYARRRSCNGPWVAANITCLKPDEKDPILRKTTREDASKRCVEIGLKPGSDFYHQCVLIGIK